MKLSIKPGQIPFMIGDTVWVNQACGETNQYPYFQATVIQIILDGTLTNSIVIRQRSDNHELLISSGIYDLKPLGVCARLGRVIASVDLLNDQKTLFSSETDLLTYHIQQQVGLLPAV